jgi:hypothetical protein
VIFGPLMMTNPSTTTNVVAMISAAVGALTLGIGCAIMFRFVEQQGREIEQLRAQLAERPREPGAA